MKERKNPFVIEKKKVFEWIGNCYAEVANGIENPEIIEYPSDGVLIAVKTVDGIGLFYDDKSRGRTVKAFGAQGLCKDTIGEIAYIDENGVRQRLAKLTYKQFGEDLNEGHFPAT